MSITLQYNYSIPWRNEDICPHKELYANVHSIINNGPKTERLQMSNGMNKQNNYTLSMEQNVDACYTMDESQKDYSSSLFKFKIKGMDYGQNPHKWSYFKRSWSCCARSTALSILCLKPLGKITFGLGLEQHLSSKRVFANLTGKQTL